MKISFTTSGSTSKTERFIKRITNGDIYNSLSKHGETGRTALARATPRDTGFTAESWTVEVRHTGQYWEIVWSNTDNENGFPVAIMLQYGHGTGTGGYVKGRDYINPAIQPIFDRIADAVWKEVVSA